MLKKKKKTKYCENELLHYFGTFVLTAMLYIKVTNEVFISEIWNYFH